MKRNSGFSLIELLIAMSIVVVILGLTYPLITDITRFKENVETKNNIKFVSDGIRKWYEKESFNIDLNSNSGLYMPDGTYSLNNSSVQGDKWQKLLSGVGVNESRMIDGFGRNFKFFVSQRLSYAHDGILIPYRIIAIVSSGTHDRSADGSSVINSSFDPSTGDLTVASGEVSEVINGLDIQLRKFEESKEKLQVLSDLYSQYYWSRYRSSANEPAIDYFAKNGTDVRWDSKADSVYAVESTCGKPNGTLNGVTILGTSLKNSKMNTALILSDSVITDAYNREFRILNCGTTSNMRVGGGSYSLSVRDPSVGNGLPPYTAALGFTLPNSESYILTVASRF